MVIGGAVVAAAGELSRLERKGIDFLKDRKKSSMKCWMMNFRRKDRVEAIIGHLKIKLDGMSEKYIIATN